MLVDKIRKYNSFVLSFGLIYLIQNFTIGQIGYLKETILFQPIYLKEVLFILTSLFINLTFFKWNTKK